jgi:uncharacterized DUF497 family protein
LRFQKEYDLIIHEIIWKQKFVEKLSFKHRVSIEEAEEVLGGKPVIRKMGRGHVKGEDVYAAYSQINTGRYLIVFFINKKGNSALPISARDMDPSERRYYERQRT